MIFEVEQAAGGCWKIRPTSGLFHGVVVAYAEGVEMRDAVIDYPTITGTICAVWGMAVDVPSIYGCNDTLRGLRINKAFRHHASRPLALGRPRDQSNEMWFDKGSGCVMEKARNIDIFGDSIYWGD